VDTLTLKSWYRLRSRQKAGSFISLPPALMPGVKVRIDSSGWYVTKIECSLPRVLFGHNGRLIENQMQFTIALQRLMAALSKLMAVPAIEAWFPWRIDFTWNYAFHISSRALIRAHSSLLIPSIRNEPTLHKGGQGIAWLGAKSRIKVMLYLKSLKMKQLGDILRGEISLCGDQLIHYLAGRDWKDWLVLWSIYYQIMASIPPVVRPMQCEDWQEALGQESIEVQDRVLARLAHKSRKTLRRYRQRVQAAAANPAKNFSWAEILSPDGPPKPVHVEPRARHKLISLYETSA
jgi:hypothetical protein